MLVVIGDGEVLLGELADRVRPARLADATHHRLVGLARSERVLAEHLAGREAHHAFARSRACAAASSTLAEPIMLTRIVVTGLRITVSMPAIAAQCTTCVWPRIASVSAGRSRMSPRTTCTFGCEASAVDDSASRAKLS